MSNGEGKSFRILVVEDNPADVGLLRRALRDAGLTSELTVVDDGADALAFVRQEPAQVLDLAVIDLNLPKHSGLEVLEEIRASRTMAELPVVILSSSSSLRERASIARLRVAKHIVKPPDLDAYLKIGWDLKELLTDRSPRRGASA